MRPRSRGGHRSLSLFAVSGAAVGMAVSAPLAVGGGSGVAEERAGTVSRADGAAIVSVPTGGFPATEPTVLALDWPVASTLAAGSPEVDDRPSPISPASMSDASTPAPGRSVSTPPSDRRTDGGVPSTPIRPVLVPADGHAEAETVRKLGAVASERASDEGSVPESGEETGPEPYVRADGERVDAQRIRSWLDDRDSPMAAFADELIAAGHEHDVDPRLVVGIAVMESGAGRRLPEGSHNAWGWGGDGAYGLAAWPSWPASIDAFTEGLARVYDTDSIDEKMARKYVPPNWRKWLDTVRWVIDDI